MSEATPPGRIAATRVLAADDDVAVRALLDEVAASDGVAPLNEQALLHLRHPDPGADCHLLGRARGDLVGYAHLDLSRGGPVQAECAVRPAHRHSGWGRALVRAADALARPRPVQLWAHGDFPAAARLAGALGFVRVRELWTMRRRLDSELPLPPQVAGVRIRTFRAGRDDEAWLALNARAFSGHAEQGAMSQRDLDQRMAEPWFDPAGFFLAERDGQLVGFHWTKVVGTVGEVYVLGVDPAAQGGGLGKLLTLAGLRYLRERELEVSLLYVESDNTAAIAVYQRLGFAHDGTDALYRIR